MSGALAGRAGQWGRCRVPAGIFVVVEAQLSTSGIRPLAVARRLGHETVFVTNDPDRYRGIETYAETLSEHVSEVITGDTNSVDGILAAVDRLGPLAALYTHCDYNLPLVAEAAAKLGLPGLSPRAAATARDKLATRQVCAEAGVPAPGFAHAATEREAVEAARRVGFPCVVKPMTESASTGVALAFTEDRVRELFHGIADVPHDARGQRRRPGVLIEEYLVGYEVSVESVTFEGRTQVLGVTDKNLGGAPYFAETGDSFPSGLPSEVTEPLARTAVDALAAIGFDFGAAHTEIKMTADGPRLVEVNARIGGAEIAVLVEEALGFPYLEQVLRMHLGQRPHLDATRRRAAASRYLAARRPGVVTAVHGLDLAARIPGVTEVEVKVGPGDEIALPTSNHELLGHVVAVGGTPAEAGRRADAALGQIDLEVG
ncbi:ATP-grasp domain-containing protein [Kutzneria sp. NPDC052558]|uniref:ATP-grasp domain-containing protein n=1 Tax=Kutzneria sp. NPDC052558 TaxID=3364121 RepID=UPI0037C7A8E8